MKVSELLARRDDNMEVTLYKNGYMIAHIKSKDKEDLHIKLNYNNLEIVHIKVSDNRAGIDVTVA